MYRHFFHFFRPAPVIMLTHKQQNYNHSSPGEEFSDLGPSEDMNNESVAQTWQDDWTFPVVSPKARREEYEMASKFPQCSLEICIDQV